MARRLSAYREKLLARRSVIRAGLAPPAEVRAPVSEEDQALEFQHEFVSTRLNNLDYAQLRLVEEALDRLAAGDYGVCLECERPIPPTRLDAVPWARYCVPCQRQADESAAVLAFAFDDDGGSVG